MAIFFRANRKSLQNGLKSLTNLQNFRYTLAEERIAAKLHTEVDYDSVAFRGHIDYSKWKKVDARTLGITGSMIPASSWTVLKRLRREGFQAYLVGGCVRDLILNRIPKDFDVITTANHKQIRKKFQHAIIIGKRFPICRVKVKGSFVEVSSFDTVAKINEEEEIMYPKKPKGCDEKDFLRWKNSLHRDFTINSLFFDPFTCKIYDYANGMADLKALKLRTLIPAHLSFGEDCARILRGLRIAARLGLSLAKDTETAIHTLYFSIMSLDKFRLTLEMNYMLAYGAAEHSLHLLWKFKLLDSLFPFQAAYLNQLGGGHNAQSSCMLMRLFFHLDKLVACDRPCDCTVWVGLMAFHLALVTNPQDAIVICAFASVLYHGQWEEGIKFAREHAHVQNNFAPEVSETLNYESDEELARAVTKLASLVLESIAALTEKDVLSGFMSKFTTFPYSDLVFISKTTGKNVAEIFKVLVMESFSNKRESIEIDYLKLAKGHLTETRFVVAKVILETMNCEVIEKRVVWDNECLQVDSSMENSDLSFSELVEPPTDVDNTQIMSYSEIKHRSVKKLKLVNSKNISFQEECILDDRQLLGEQQSLETADKQHILEVLRQLNTQDDVRDKEDHGICLDKIMDHASDEQCLDHAASNVKKAAKAKRKITSAHKVARRIQTVDQQCNRSTKNDKVVLSSLFE